MLSSDKCDKKFFIFLYFCGIFDCDINIYIAFIIVRKQLLLKVLWEWCLWRNPKYIFCDVLDHWRQWSDLGPFSRCESNRCDHIQFSNNSTNRIDTSLDKSHRTVQSLLWRVWSPGATCKQRRNFVASFWQVGWRCNFRNKTQFRIEWD